MSSPATGLPPRPGFWRWMTYLLLMPLMAFATAAFGMASLIASTWDRPGRLQHRIARSWASAMLRLALSPVRVMGMDRLPHGAAVYAANHLSYMDTPVLFARLPFQFRILAKSGLWRLPFIGWHLRRSGQVPVDLSTARASISSLNRGVAALKQGLPLVIFPEGGRTPHGRPQPYLSGGAFMAIRAGVPLVPVTLVGTYELLPIHTYHLWPRPLLLVIGESISTAGATVRDADRLMQLAFEQITRTYLEHTGQASADDTLADQTAALEADRGRSALP